MWGLRHFSKGYRAGYFLHKDFFDLETPTPPPKKKMLPELPNPNHFEVVMVVFLPKPSSTTAGDVPCFCDCRNKQFTLGGWFSFPFLLPRTKPVMVFLCDHEQVNARGSVASKVAFLFSTSKEDNEE